MKNNSYIKNKFLNKFLTKTPIGYTFSARAETSSMEPTICTGEYIWVRRTPFKQVHIHDMIMFKRPNTPHPVVHRVVNFGSNKLGPYLITKGDNLQTNDSYRIRKKDFIGTVYLEKSIVKKISFFLRRFASI